MTEHPALYNEIDPFAARWLRNLIAAGHIAPGAVDERSVKDLVPADVAGLGQRHFFAGIAGWSLALRLAGVPDDADVWTGSCPCQSLSDAGKRLGFADERHLWPAWFGLIAECRPAVVFGEQVASSLGLEWLDLVFADLEGAGYACAAADLCAAGAGAPHQRQRLFFVAHANRKPGRLLAAQRQPGRADAQAERSGKARSVAHASELRRKQGTGTVRSRESNHAWGRLPSIMGNAGGPRGGRNGRAVSGAQAKVGSERVGDRGVADISVAASHSGWRNCDWIPCSDGVSRPVEPGTHPLASSVSACMERMRAIEDAGWKEVVDYAGHRKGNPDEVLRMVRESVHSAARREDGKPGVRQQLHAPEVLLSFLFCVEATHARGVDRGGVKEARKQARYRIMRGMRLDHGSGRPSCERRSDGQHSGESSDPVHKLSLVLARYAEAHRAIAGEANASSDRVGKLRGYGNAIVPQVAATFIRAALEAA